MSTQTRLEPPVVSIIVPMLDEALVLPELLAHLRGVAWDRRIEVLAVDGGSTDIGPELVKAAGFSVLYSAPGRAAQMNAGAREARGGLLLFLHADTRLPSMDLEALVSTLARSNRHWGRFDVRIDGRSPWLPLIAALMNLRSRLTGIATGDQCLFITREAFDRVNGFPEQPLMEDIEISRRLKAVSRPLCLSDAVRTSGRRWDERGAWRTIWLMWQLRWAYWRGKAPTQLLERYR